MKSKSERRRRLPREVRTELTALINSGHCNWHTTVDLVLTDATELFWSTGEIHVNRFGKNQQYVAKIERDVPELAMSVDVEVDGIDIKVANVDMVIGRTLTSSVRKLDGAEAVVGILFIDTSLPVAQAIWDAKVPCLVMTGEVGDEAVAFSLVSSIDGIVVAGRTIAEEFQWQEPVSNVPVFDPNDIDPRNPDNFPGRRGGRYLDYEPMVMPT